MLWKESCHLPGAPPEKPSWGKKSWKSVGGKEDSLAGGRRGQQESPSPGQNYKWTLPLLSGNNIAAKSISGHKHVTLPLIGWGCPPFSAAAVPAAPHAVKVPSGYPSAPSYLVSHGATLFSWLGVSVSLERCANMKASPAMLLISRTAWEAQRRLRLNGSKQYCMGYWRNGLGFSSTMGQPRLRKAWEGWGSREGLGRTLAGWGCKTCKAVPWEGRVWKVISKLSNNLRWETWQLFT